MLLATAALFVTDPPLPSYTLASCDDPVQRSQILATDPEKVASLDGTKARSAAKEAETDALLNKLAARAQLTDEQKAEVAMKIFESPEFNAEFDKGMKLVSAMMEHLSAIMKSKEALPNCRVVVRMMQSLPEIEANADRQWEIIRKIFDDEAARRGVSLAD
jgi:hypothetical protein